MRDLAAVSGTPAAELLVEDIARSRRDFPNSQLSFQLEFSYDGPADLAALCQAVAGTGLTLVELRAGANGIVHCSLIDDGRTALPLVLQGLGSSITLNRWTTQIGF